MYLSSRMICDKIKSMFRIRIRIRIDFAWLDPDPGGQKLPQKIGKREENFQF
jgi:hypothetical protein